MTPADYRMDEDRQVRSVTAALLLSAEGVAQRRLGKRAARSQKGVSAWRSGATARTAGGARGTARGRRDPALRTDPGSSPGVYATPSAKCSSAPSARAALLLSMQRRSGGLRAARTSTNADRRFRPTTQSTPTRSSVRDDRLDERPLTRISGSIARRFGAVTQETPTAREARRVATS